MSWKPCRGGRVLLDKAVKDSHECYFKFWETHDFVEKCKVAFRWMKAEQYLRKYLPIEKMGQDFINECKSNPKTYKPLLNLLKSIE